ncbi:MAG: nuclear transport factor 2 family protein [Kordiimonas sp.]
MMDISEQARRYIEAFNAHNIEALTDMLSEKVELKDWEVQLEGRATVLEHMRTIFNNVPAIRADVIDIISAKNACVLLLSIFIEEGVSLQVADVLKFDTNGTIVSVHAYKR